MYFIKFTVFTVTALATLASACLQNDWTLFKLKFGKNYPMEEDQKRFAIYKENMQKINTHNKIHSRMGKQ